MADIVSPFSFRMLEKASWGPLLVAAGIFLLYVRGGGGTVPAVTSSFLIFSGVAIMFRQLGGGGLATQIAAGSEGDVSDADYVVKQLSRNFEILRAQTNQGFILSGVFMSVGLLLIAFSLLAPTFGFQTGGVEKLGVVAGIITEFISGTALFLYRVNFSRLNQTSDQLDGAWRVLAAFKLTRELPEDKKAEATIALIDSLTATPGSQRKSRPEAQPGAHP